MKFASKIVQCAAMFLLAATAAFSQAPTPTSGVVLTIYDSNNNLVGAIWDSQIHTGTVVTSPCDGSAFNMTDAFVYQGSSWIGCDNGDAIETNNYTQRTGTKTVGNFTFQTQYIYNTTDQQDDGEGYSICNNNGNICIYPASQGGGANGLSIDTGFVTVTYNGTGGGDETPFAGTITLSGIPNLPNTDANPNPWCPGPGIATDQITFSGENLLPVGGKAVFALAIDSSNCGGWGADLALPITAMQPTTFLFGKDSFQVTPNNSLPGDTILFRPIAVPLSDFGMPGPTLPNTSPFGGGTQCITYADFSAEGAAGNQLGVCAELQTTCINPNAHNNPPACDDGETFTWTGELGFVIDQDSLPSGVGGVHFLGEKAANCPQNTFGTDGIISFTGSGPGLDPPLHPGGSGLNCFAATYTVGATPITSGTTTAFNFEFPSSTKLNKVCPGCVYAFTWDQYNGANIPPIPLTNLHYCFNPNPNPLSPSPTGCGTSQHPVPTPWVSPQQIPITCPDDGAAPNFSAGPIIPVLGLLNFGRGEYVFSAIAPFHQNGCFTLELIYSFGLAVPAATYDIEPLFEK